MWRAWWSLLFVACQPSAPAPSPGTPPSAIPPPPVPSASAPRPPAASGAVADLAPAPDADSDEACAPLALEPPELPHAAHSVEGLVTLLENPDVTLAAVERDFGKAHDSKTHSTSWDIDAPLPGVARVVIGWRRSQNRESLERFDLEFTKGSEPSVEALAKRLGVSAGVGKEAVRNTCTDGVCPAISFDWAKQPRALSFRLTEPASSSLGSKNVAKLAVASLSGFVPAAGCATGTKQVPATPLPSATGREKELQTALGQAAALLRAEPLDKAKIEGLLGPFGRVQVEHNDMSKFSWVRLFPDSDHPLAPFCVAGFRYVRDPKLLCHIAYSHRHLYETDGNATHRLFLTVELGNPYGKSDDHVSHVELTLMPKDWKDVVF